ncbi:unnamed protein product [Absidia cylindrospora]
MPPKKKLTTSTSSKKRPKTAIPDDAQWCMDNSRRLTFRKFIEKFDSLDQREFEQRYCNILTKYVDNESKERAGMEYNTWIKSADYKSTRFIRSVTDERMKSLIAKANAVIQTTTNDTTDDPETTSNDPKTINNATDDQEATNDTDTRDNGDAISPFDLDNSGDIGDDPWFFRGNNITRMFKDYQSIVQSLVRKHSALPLESYINELAALTHILLLNKHQHSSISKKVFSVELLDDLAVSLVSESMDYSLSMNEQQYMTMAKIINQLSLSNTTREKAFFELTLMSSSMAYGERRLIRGLTNL